MTKFNSSALSRRLATAILRKKLAVGLPRSSAKKIRKINSLGTLRNYIQCLSVYLQWAIHNQIDSDFVNQKRYILAFMEELSETNRNDSLCQYAAALGFTFACKVKPPKSLIHPINKDRSYLKIEFKKILSRLSEKNRISVELAFWSGLRAHEPATIRRISESSASDHRNWSRERFLGRQDLFSVYVVNGKGGLKREVAVPNWLAKKLEARRLNMPIIGRDRGIDYEMYYDVGFGSSLSMAFVRASRKSLGWSNGLHGLRHSFTHWRLRSLCEKFDDWNYSASIISQELGHFRLDITYAYF